MISTKHIVTSITEVPSSWVFETYCNLSEKLMGQDVKITSLFNSRDTVPSMVIFCREDRYFFKDFSTDKGGDSTTFVSFFFNLSKGQAINKILEDYREYLKSSGGRSPVVVKQKASYKLESYDTRGWTRGDADYWLAYGIDSDILELYNVKPLSSFTFSKNDDGAYDFFVTQKPYVYGYFREDGTLYKIYQPYNKDKKFMKLATYIQGMDQLKFDKEHLVITSSLKDGMCLKKLGYPVEFIAPDSEGSVIREEVITYLKSKYKVITCMFDNDTAGIKAMERYHELYGLPSILLPMEKDLSDSVKKHSQKAVKQVLTPLLNAYEQTTEKSNGTI
jgi:hypothetical protein